VRINPFWQIWGSGESKSVGTLTISFSHRLAFHQQENMISVSIPIRQQKLQVFTKLDLASGYHQVRVHSDDCHKTAFVAPDGYYQYKVIPFGLANAPAAFMRMMHKILHPHRRNAIVYLDDVLIFSGTLAEHKAQVEGVLQALRNARLRLSEGKCVFGSLETSFVSFRVNKYGIHTEEKKVRAVQDWPTPRTPTELRSFLSLAGYYRKFIPKFAIRANLLYDLCRKAQERLHVDQLTWRAVRRPQAGTDICTGPGNAGSGR